ncbi:MAG: hypothetical protein RLZZ337_290 [Bacteroidota bacterium]|jgi:iron complex outermembrane receptor protein
MLKKYTSILFVCFTTLVYGQEPLDSVVVSTTRLPISKYESGKNITVISQKEIQNLPINSLDELLYYVGGVNINSRSGFGVQSDIGMRGSTFSQVLILVDNQRISDPLTAHFNSNLPIPLSEIHHIEIVRGSAAASFGADAVGGIIHIKTKTYQHLFGNKVEGSFNGFLGIGEHNLTTTDVSLNQQLAKLGFSTAVKTTSSVGEMRVNPNYTSAGLGDSLYYSNFDLKTYTSAINYRGNKLKLYARFGGDFREFDAKYFYTASVYDESKEKISAYWSQFTGIYNGKNSNTELNIGYRNNRDSFAFNPLFSANQHTTKRLNSTLSQYRKAFGMSMSYGWQMDLQTIESTDRGNHDAISNAAFLIVTKKIDLWTLSGGLRLESSEKIGNQLVPQVNVAYRQSRFILRSSAGRSIRQADFTERYTSYLIPNLTAGRNVGNPDLVAESSYTIDAGIDFRKVKNYSWCNTIFIRTSTNLIDYTLTNSSAIANLTNLLPNTDYLYAQNISCALTWGNEFYAKHAAQVGETEIETQLNYTYLNTSIADNVVSKYIANHPVHNINATMCVNMGAFTLMTSGFYITRNAEAIEAISAEIKANYTVFNAKLSYRFKMVPASLFIDVRNITNTQFQEILGSKMPSRWILGGFKWDISI